MPQLSADAMLNNAKRYRQIRLQFLVFMEILTLRVADRHLHLGAIIEVRRSDPAGGIWQNEFTVVIQYGRRYITWDVFLLQQAFQVA